MRISFLSASSVGILLATQLHSWNSSLMPGGVWEAPDSTYSFSSDKLLQDFHYAGYRMGTEPPVVAGPILDVSKAPWNADKSGVNDATTAIQAAIDSAGKLAKGGVVYLPAGTYKVSVTKTNGLEIRKSNVVLRGAGPSQTKILNSTTAMNSKTLIRFSGSGSWTSQGTRMSTITKDLDGPTRKIPVADASKFTVGEWVILRNDITDDWANEHKEDGWVGYGSKFSGMVYLRQILAKQGNVLEIDIPIRYTLRTRDNARVYNAPTHIEEVGIEELSLANLEVQGTGWGEEDYKVATNASYNTHSSYLLNFFLVRNGWIRNVHTWQPAQNTLGSHLLSNGILVASSRNVTVQGIDFRRPLYGGGGGNGYMLRLQAQENLVRKSKVAECRHGYVLSHMLTSGNVFHQVVDSVTGKQRAGTGTTSGKGSDNHMHFSHSNLYDQIKAHDSYFEAAYRAYGSAPFHNLTAAHSVYWNARGEGGRSYVVHTQQARYGYVIGTQGAVTTVNTSNRPTSSGTKTDPADHVEGVGLGTTLQPQSLYLYQMAKSAPPSARPSLGALTPVANSILVQGDTLLVTAQVVDPDNATQKIDLWLNGSLLRSEATAPYDWGKAGQDTELKTLAVGSHSLRFYLYDSQGVSDSATVPFKVQTPVEILPFQNATKALPNARIWDLLGRSLYGDDID